MVSFFAVCQMILFLFCLTAQGLQAAKQTTLGVCKDFHN